MKEPIMSSVEKESLTNIRSNDKSNGALEHLQLPKTPE